MEKSPPELSLSYSNIWGNVASPKIILVLVPNATEDENTFRKPFGQGPTNETTWLDEFRAQIQESLLVLGMTYIFPKEALNSDLNTDFALLAFRALKDLVHKISKETHTILFIAHGTGGYLLKQMLIILEICKDYTNYWTELHWLVAFINTPNYFSNVKEDELEAILRQQFCLDITFVPFLTALHQAFKTHIESSLSRAFISFADNNLQCIHEHTVEHIDDNFNFFKSSKEFTNTLLDFLRKNCGSCKQTPIAELESTLLIIMWMREIVKLYKYTKVDITLSSKEL